MTLLVSLAIALGPSPTIDAAPVAVPAAGQQGALASWYYDDGETASGRHYRYGFASLLFGSSWGQRVRFCRGSRCVIGRLDDHGPYVVGRSFDLNSALRSALRCPDLCWLRWAAIA